MNPSEHKSADWLYETIEQMVNLKQINIDAIAARLNKVDYAFAQPILVEMEKIKIYRDKPTNPKIAALAVVAFDWYYGKLAQSKDPNVVEVRQCLEGILKR